MAHDVVSATTLVLAWGSLLVRLHTLHWRPRNPVQQSFCGTLLAVALTMTVMHPPIYRAIDRTSGIANVSRLVGNALGVLAAWAFQPVIAALLRYQARRNGPLGSGWLALTVVCIMGVLFHAMLVPVSAPKDFQERYGAAPFVAEYRLTLYAYLGLIWLRLFRLSLRNTEAVRSIGQSHRRLWARLQTVGWGLGCLYALHECAYVILRRLDVISAGLPYDTALSYGLLTGFFLLVLSGVILNGFHWLSWYRAYHVLYPLWRDLRAAMPGTGPAFRLARRDFGTPKLEFRLHRRVTEIRDGIVVLHPYIDERDGVPPGTEDAAFENRAMVEAGAIASGIARRRRNIRATFPRIAPIAIATGETFDEEVRALTNLAVAYRRMTTRSNSYPDSTDPPSPEVSTSTVSL